MSKYAKVHMEEVVGQTSQLTAGAEKGQQKTVEGRSFDESGAEQAN